MHAIQMKRTGGPEVLEFVEVPTPRPGPTEVLIKAHAIGVGMPEVLLRRGEYAWMPPLPVIPGIEMSGTIDAVGQRVTRFRVGQAVFASAREFKFRGGCYAQYLAAEENTVYALPDGVDLDEAAALSNYQVAWHLLNTATQGFRYETLLVLAAAGGVGSALVQLAKAAGKQVIGVVDTEEKARFALSQGADAAVDYHTGQLEAVVRDQTAARGIDLVLDPVGGAGTARNINLLAPFGMLIVFGELDGHPSGNLFEALRQPPMRSLALRHFTMHTLDKTPERRAPATQELFRLLASTVIRPPIHARIPLAEAAKAHELLESGKVLGKLIMKP